MGSALRRRKVVNVVICDDHPVFREGLKTALGQVPDFAVVGEAASGPELLELLGSTPCNVIILDIAMPGPDGLDVLKDLEFRGIQVPVLMLSMHPEDHFALRAFRGGAAGYLTKNSPMPQLIEALRKVADGGRYVSPAMAERLADEVRGGAKPGHERLSDREFQVLMKLVSGESLKEIAAELNISPSTIGTHRSRILDKLGLRTRADLIRYAMEHKLAD